MRYSPCLPPWSGGNHTNANGRCQTHPRPRRLQGEGLCAGAWRTSSAAGEEAVGNGVGAILQVAAKTQGMHQRDLLRGKSTEQEQRNQGAGTLQRWASSLRKPVIERGLGRNAFLEICAQRRSRTRMCRPAPNDARWVPVPEGLTGTPGNFSDTDVLPQNVPHFLKKFKEDHRLKYKLKL